MSQPTAAGRPKATMSDFRAATIMLASKAPTSSAAAKAQSTRTTELRLEPSNIASSRFVFARRPLSHPSALSWAHSDIWVKVRNNRCEDREEYALICGGPGGSRRGRRTLKDGEDDDPRRCAVPDSGA